MDVALRRFAPPLWNSKRIRNVRCTGMRTPGDCTRVWFFSVAAEPSVLYWEEKTSVWFRARERLRRGLAHDARGEAVSRESSADAAMHQMDVSDSALFMNGNNDGEIFTRKDAKAIEEALKCAICECVWNGGDRNSENVTFLGKELYDAISEARGYKKEGDEDASRDEGKEKEKEKESDDEEDGWGNDDDGWSVDDDPLLVHPPPSLKTPRVELPDDVRLFLDDFVQDKALFTSTCELIVSSRVICRENLGLEGMMNNATDPFRCVPRGSPSRTMAFTSLAADIASRRVIERYWVAKMPNVSRYLDSSEHSGDVYRGSSKVLALVL